ncbi:MarR family transcriptional regulator [Bacillus gobiensis]|uniref:MarR family winged helix-turn-helix transcriptional regulator n=1 Tax=Bacillus gobiensis TaxID=1441095 RepID=UPI003D237B13
MVVEKTKEDGDLSLKLFVVLTRALQSVKKRVVEDIRTYGLNPTEFAVLELLFSKGEHPIQKIGDKVLIASSSITYVVDKLENKKLVERKACPKDRRTTYAAITAEGKKLMDDIFPNHKNSIQEIFGGLTADEKEEMIKQLKKLGFYAQGL